jgi:hypothetical protein
MGIKMSSLPMKHERLSGTLLNDVLRDVAKSFSIEWIRMGRVEVSAPQEVLFVKVRSIAQFMAGYFEDVDRCFRYFVFRDEECIAVADVKSSSGYNDMEFFRSEIGGSVGEKIDILKEAEEFSCQKGGNFVVRMIEILELQISAMWMTPAKESWEEEASVEMHKFVMKESGEAQPRVLGRDEFKGALNRRLLALKRREIVRHQRLLSGTQNKSAS